MTAERVSVWLLFLCAKKNKKILKKVIDKLWKIWYTLKTVFQNGCHSYLFVLTSKKKCKKVLTKRERSDIIEKLPIGQGLVIENWTTIKEDKKCTRRNSCQILREPEKEKKRFGWIFVMINYEEFDPGSGLTLAACITHSSRTERGSFGCVNQWRTGE